ncbi:hypothetical protein KATP_07530 [Kluyvera ascorbata]|nr:hypothetical protein KATP_07530 [Kluyvera ascorbata]
MLTSFKITVKKNPLRVVRPDEEGIDLVTAYLWQIIAVILYGFKQTSSMPDGGFALSGLQMQTR